MAQNRRFLIALAVAYNMQYNAAASVLGRLPTAFASRVTLQASLVATAWWIALGCSEAAGRQSY